MWTFFQLLNNLCKKMCRSTCFANFAHKFDIWVVVKFDNNTPTTKIEPNKPNFGDITMYLTHLSTLYITLLLFKASL